MVAVVIVAVAPPSQTASAGSDETLTSALSALPAAPSSAPNISRSDGPARPNLISSGFRLGIPAFGHAGC